MRDRTVLLSGAGSSCADYLGGWTIRRGARRVIGIYRSENRMRRLRALGIEPVSMHDAAGISAAAVQADVTFDALGGDIANGILGLMPEGTSFVAYGLLTGKSVVISEATKAAYHRFHMRDYLASVAVKGMSDAFADIWPMLAEAAPAEPTVYPARNWRDALAEVRKPGARKPILDISSLA